MDSATGHMDSATDLTLLIRSRHPLIVVETVEEERLLRLLRRVATRLQVPLFAWSRTRGLQRAGQEGAVYDSTDPLKLLAHLEAADADGVYLLADYHHYLDSPDTVRALREMLKSFTADGRALILSGVGIELPEELRRQSVPFRFALPDAAELRRELDRTLDRLHAQPQPVQVELSPEQTDELVRNLQGLTLDEARRILHGAILRDSRLDESDLQHVLVAKREALGRDGLLEFYPPSEELTTLGDMKRLKAWLEKRKSAFSKEAEQFGLETPKGVMLIGVQGCGKSLAARCIASTWGFPLLRLDPSVLYDKYVGESEKNLRRAIDVAESMSPVVLWIDEIEKGFAPTGGDQDGGLSKRIFATFLTWMQERPAPVFLMATSNDVEALPVEVLRRGRFDEIFFVDLPDPQTRATILHIHLAGRGQDPKEFNLAQLMRESEGFSGAELEQAIVSAMYAAGAASESLTTGHIADELSRTRPLSVVMREKISALRAWAADRTVAAG